MADDPDDFGEKTATAADAEAWVETIKAGRRATVGYHFKRNKIDSMRPPFGGNVASSESGDD